MLDIFNYQSYYETWWSLQVRCWRMYEEMKEFKFNLSSWEF